MIDQILIVAGIIGLILFVVSILYLNIEKQRKKMFKHFKDMG
jgi:FtsZ-interacting cell division protein ZipA